MAKNNNQGTNIDLLGRDLKKAKEGLEERIQSLTQLAQRTIEEASSATKTLKKQALEEAKAGADALLSQAREQAQRIVEGKTAEARRVLAQAEEEARQIIEAKRNEFRASFGTIGELLVALRRQAAALKQRAAVLETDIDGMLSQMEKPAAILTETVSQATPVATMDETTDDDKAPDSPPEPVADKPIQTTEKKPAEEDEGKVDEPEAEADTFEGDVELEILPPQNKNKLREIIKQLGNMPEVADTHHIPIENKPMIALSLQEPLSLIQRLKSLPEVNQAWEVKHDKEKAIIGSGYNQENSRRVLISLWL